MATPKYYRSHKVNEIVEFEQSGFIIGYSLPIKIACKVIVFLTPSQY